MRSSAYRQADELDPDNGNDDDKPGWLSEPAREDIAGRDSRQIAERGFNSPGAHASGDESGARASAQAPQRARVDLSHRYLGGCRIRPGISRTFPGRRTPDH